MKKDNQSKPSATHEYAKMFDNWTELAHPAWITHPDYEAFWMEAVRRGRPWTRRDAEERLGEVAWNW